MRFRPDRLLLTLLTLLTLMSPVSLPVVIAEEEPLPSVELLDFLSLWETDEGEWADPELFEEDMFEQMSGYLDTEDEFVQADDAE